MANVAVQKIEDKSARPLPLFQELEKQFEQVRRRAFDLFEKRGRELGHAVEDWLKAEHDVVGWPAAELSDKEAKYDLTLTLPGYDPKDIEVTVTPSKIIVHANVATEKKEEKEECVFSEFKSNDVYRRFELPEPIDIEKANATLEKGMLHVVAEKAPKAQAKAIEVKS